MPDSYEEARAAILAKYRQYCADHEKSQQNVEVVQAHQRELMVKINDCFAAARLFGFDLVAEFKSEANGDPRQPTLQAPDPITPSLSPVPAMPGAKEGCSVKTLVLDALERAYPNPIRAGGVRKDLASRGYITHDKTVGMTLYRWSLVGCARRAGRDWYFVPSGQRTVRKANGRPHKAALSSDDLLSAAA